MINALDRHASRLQCKSTATLEAVLATHNRKDSVLKKQNAKAVDDGFRMKLHDGERRLGYNDIKDYGMRIEKNGLVSQR